MDYAALKTYLTDPARPPEYAAAWKTEDNAAVVAQLNAKAVRGPVPIAEVAAYCCRAGITGGVMALIEIPVGSDIAPGVPMTLPTKGMLHTVLTLIQLDYRLETADVDDKAFQGACDGLVQLGVMTPGQKADILALGDNRQSEAESRFGRAVTLDDVRAARTAGGI